MSELQITELSSAAEFDSCVDLQQQTWQYSAGEALPRRVFFLAAKLGGLVLGAWQGRTLAAFNLGMAAQRGGHAYLHSQMLAVLPQHRNSGVGRQMKLVQRDFAIRQGLPLIEWTFDPLEIKNSFFNLARLGAICRRYVPDFYGPSSSPLQGGLPTDRLYAEWWVQSDHAERVLRREPPVHTVRERVSVPAQIYAWKAEGDSRALQTQTVLRERLMRLFADGLCITGYERAEDGTGSFLLSEPPPEFPPFQETP